MFLLYFDIAGGEPHERGENYLMRDCTKGSITSIGGMSQSTMSARDIAPIKSIR